MTKHEALIRDIAFQTQRINSADPNDMTTQMVTAKMLLRDEVSTPYVQYYADRVVHFLQFNEIA